MRNHVTEIICDSCQTKYRGEVPPPGWTTIELSVCGSPDSDPKANVIPAETPTDEMEGHERTWNGTDVKIMIDLCNRHFCRAYGVGQVLMTKIGTGAQYRSGDSYGLQS